MAGGPALILVYHLGRSDFAELLQGGFEVFDDLLGKNIGIGKIVVSDAITANFHYPTARFLTLSKIETSSSTSLDANTPSTPRGLKSV